jgi:hypothetical protein
VTSTAAVMASWVSFFSMVSSLWMLVITVSARG